MPNTTKNGILLMDPLIVPYLIVGMLFRLFALESFTVSSGSMLPTLTPGDYVMASKFSYGYSQFSFGAHIPPFEMLRSPPHRGDIAFFALPRDPKTTYVMRVIGLPGDRVQLKDGIVYLNGVPLKREPAGHFDRMGSASETYVNAPLYRETLPDGRSYVVMELTAVGEGDNSQEYVVPEGHYFVMGDNRDNSSDSRYRVGFLPEANIFAKAFLRFGSDGGYLHTEPFQ